MHDVVYKDLMKRFREPPDMGAPIDKYFRKQQECRLRSQDSDDPITEKGMVIQLTTHLGKTVLINKQVTKFRNQTNTADKTWDNAKNGLAKHSRNCAMRRGSRARTRRSRPTPPSNQQPPK